MRSAPRWPRTTRRVGCCRNFPAASTGDRTAAARSTTLLAPLQLRQWPIRRCLPAARGGALCRDRAARHVDHGAGACGLRRQGRAAVHRRRLLHQDAREPAADRPAAGRGRLHLGRVLGIWRHGVVCRWRAPRPAYPAGARCRTTRRPSSCRATRTRNTAPCWTPGATAGSSDIGGSSEQPFPMSSRRLSPGIQPSAHAGASGDVGPGDKPGMTREVYGTQFNLGRKDAGRRCKAWRPRG